MPEQSRKHPADGAVEMDQTETTGLEGVEQLPVIDPPLKDIDLTPKAIEMGKQKVADAGEYELTIDLGGN